MVALLPHDACFHQVIDERGCTLVLLQLRLILLKLALSILKLRLLLRKLSLHFIEPGHLCTNCVLLLEISLLGVGDLGLGSSPLGAGLEHVDSSAMEHYREKED